MATYVNDLRLKEIATGDESGTWGTSTNTNLELMQDYIDQLSESISSLSDEEKEEVEEMKRTYGSGNNFKVCFNEHNIVTYSYMGDDDIPETINELDSFSLTVEDESVFEPPVEPQELI